MITSALARSHAVAIDDAIIYGTSGVLKGIAGQSGTDKVGTLQATTSATAAQLDGSEPFTAAMLEVGRAAMGKYAVNPADIAYVVSIDVYYDLLAEPNGRFLTVDKAGSDFATNINGQMGTIFGSPVIVSAELAPADAGTAALVINTGRFVVPRLRGVSIETDYEVGRQRNVLVASQALGFKGLETTKGAHALTLLAN
jgi:HK97 family phage major capsid protein